MSSEANRAPVNLRIFAAFATLQGADDSLQSLNTFEVPDGALAMVRENNTLYEFERESAAEESLPTILKPTAGPGIWFSYPYPSDPVEISGALFGGKLSQLISALISLGLISASTPNEYGCVDRRDLHDNTAVGQPVIGTSPTGLYQVDVNLRVTTPGTTGNIAVELNYLNRVGGTVTATTSTKNITTTGLIQQSFILDVSNPDDLQAVLNYNVIGVVTPGALAYDLIIVARRIALLELP